MLYTSSFISQFRQLNANKKQFEKKKPFNRKHFIQTAVNTIVQQQQQSFENLKPKTKKKCLKNGNNNKPALVPTAMASFSRLDAASLTSSTTFCAVCSVDFFLRLKRLIVRSPKLRTDATKKNQYFFSFNSFVVIFFQC